MPASTLDRLLDGAANPAAPLITYYDVSSGERVELSATTTANWVAKTSNFLVDELELDFATRVRIGLPPHWLRLVCVLSVWSVGWVIADDDARVAVTGPDLTADEEVRVAASLLPLGRGFATPPSGFIDLTAEVLNHPDHFFADESPTPTSDAVDLEGRASTHAEWLSEVAPDDRRLLLTSTDLVAEMRAITAALLGSGSLVVVTGATPDDLARLAAQENAVLEQG